MDNADFKWKDEGNDISKEVSGTLQKIRDEKLRTENKIYHAIKVFEANSGISVKKVEFEPNWVNGHSSSVTLLLERI